MFNNIVKSKKGTPPQDPTEGDVYDPITPGDDGTDPGY